jgi:hypothetical protein
MANTNTTLHFAVQNGNIDIVKMLLDAGHDLNAVNTEGLTPLDLAVTVNNTEVVQLLLKHKGKTTAPPTIPKEVDMEQKKYSGALHWPTVLGMIVVFTMISFRAQNRKEEERRLSPPIDIRERMNIPDIPLSKILESMEGKPNWLPLPQPVKPNENEDASSPQQEVEKK